jgi:hypothetical protein
MMLRLWDVDGDESHLTARRAGPGIAVELGWNVAVLAVVSGGAGRGS